MPMLVSYFVRKRGFKADVSQTVTQTEGGQYIA